MIIYTAKVPTIVNYTIVAANTWEQALNTDNIAGFSSIRKWLVKANEDTYNAFRLAFADNPSSWLSTSGIGYSFDGCALQDVWVYSPNVGTRVEILYWS